MAYTVVGLFPNNEMAATASGKLDTAGFAKEDYSVSNYNNSGDYDADMTRDFDYEEDEKTTGFWDWLFGDDTDERRKYSYAGTKSNVVTVYTDDLDRAERAREIMNDNGALDVNDVSRDYVSGNTGTEVAEEFISTEPNSVNKSERARILNKARNDIYMSPSERSYSWKRRGMTNDMDSMGNADNL